MAVYDTSPYSEEDIPQLIGIKTNIGGFFFDAVLKVDHNSKMTITEHPVEEGSNIADHAFLEPESLSMEIGMSDVCSSFINGQFSHRYTRSVSAFDTIKQLQADRVPMTVHTRLKTYRNMLVETISVPDDFQTLFGLRASIGLREVIVVSTATVALPDRSSASPHTTGQTNRGTVQPIGDTGVNENRSVLRRAADLITGG
jgi:hypothetical protein